MERWFEELEAKHAVSPSSKTISGSTPGWASIWTFLAGSGSHDRESPEHRVYAAKKAAMYRKMKSDAEKLYRKVAVKGENGLVLESYVENCTTNLHQRVIAFREVELAWCSELLVRDHFFSENHHI